VTRRHAFVAGAGGYIGGHLVRELAAAGWTVTGLVRRPDQAASIEAMGAHAAVGDLSEPFVQPADIAKDTVVFHLAVPFTTLARGVEDGRSLPRPPLAKSLGLAAGAHGTCDD
jgi:nucleoside-diphosphate-sugar epimerase